MKIILRIILLFFLFAFKVNSLFAQAPVANFSVNDTSSCNFLVAQFTDLSTNSPTSWYWNLGNGTTSNLQNPSTTYTTPGTYTVVLTATNASGSNTKTIINYITILPSPTVSFAANDTLPGCGTKTVIFTSSSSLGISGSGSYYWDFGDGSSSISTNPTHTYTNPGTYNVALVVTNSGGCSKTLSKSNYITVLGKPAVSFSAINNNSCTLPLNVGFTNSTTGATSYIWNFGDGGTSTASNPSHQYTTYGAFTVRLIASNIAGCSDTSISPSLVNIGNLTPGFTASNTTACVGSNILFTNSTTPSTATSFWNFGDGTNSIQNNPSHAYTSPGTYLIKLVSSINTCSDSVTHSVTVLSGPVSQFSASQVNACTVPFTTVFSNTSTGAVTSLWSFGDGSNATSTSPSHTYNALGNYTVTLISSSSNGCKDTLTKPAYINIQHTAVTINGNLSLGCAPASGSFNAITSGLFPISNYAWDFGDGNTGSGAAVSHTYALAGNYVLKLKITNTNGCSDSVSAMVTVNNRPVASFTGYPLTVCLSNPVTFVNNSTGANAYYWDFGDSSTSTSANPVHLFRKPGVFSVKLVVFSDECSDTLVITNYVHTLVPMADFKTSYPCSNRKQFTIVNTSIGGTSFNWDFGDGNTSTLKNPGTHTYASNGTYTITLNVSDSTTGCSHSTSKIIPVFDLSALFYASDTFICRDYPITFQAAYQNYTSYTWNFGDGTTGTGASISKTYTTNGIFTDKLVVSDETGCKDSLTKVHYINVHGPNIAFSNLPLNGCGPMNVSFTDLTTVAAGSSILNRTWDYGDGTIVTGVGSNVSHWYATPGSYSVKLIIKEGGGCTDSLTKPGIVVVNRPLASFATNDTLACPKQPIQFSNFSTGHTAITYDWDFGDGNTSTLANPIHVYTAGGNFTIKLIVTDATGCKDTLTRNSYVKVRSIKAGFITSDTLAFCPPVKVNFTNTSVNAISYSWNFGNGSTIKLADPTTIFILSGIYPVRLIATNIFGCSDTANQTIVVKTKPTGTLDYSPKIGCNPLNVRFKVKSDLNSTNYITYDFDNGVTMSTTDSNLLYTYELPGKFVPKIILSNAGGCSSSVLGFDTITVYQKQPVHLDSAFAICLGDSTSLVTSGGNIFNWQPTIGLSCTNCANPIASPPYTITYTVTLKQGYCQPEDLKATVTVNPLPVVDAGPDVNVIPGNAVQLQAGGTNIAKFQWSPAEGLSCTNCSNPMASPVVQTTYIVEATSEFGCKSLDSIKVNILCDGSQVWMPNTFTPNHDGQNDYFYPHGKGITEIKRFRIFDRWGELVFDRSNMPVNDSKMGWDGTYRNQNLKPDVFVWVMNATCSNGQPLELKGSISLLR